MVPLGTIYIFSFFKVTVLHKSSIYGQSSRSSSPPPLCKYLASTSRTYRWSPAVLLLCAAALLAHIRRIPFPAVPTCLSNSLFFYGFSFSTWRPHKKSWLLNGTLTLTCSPAAIQGASRSLQLHVAVSCKHQRVVQIFRFICVRVTPLFFLCPRVRQILFFFEWAVNVAHVSILGNLLYFLFCSYTYTIYSNWQSSSRLLFFPSFRPFPSLFFSSLPLPSCLFIPIYFAVERKFHWHVEGCVAVAPVGLRHH